MTYVLNMVCQSVYFFTHILTCCVKDIIIVEDDPYYFLQEGPFYPKHLRRSDEAPLSEEDANRKSSTHWLLVI